MIRAVRPWVAAVGMMFVACGGGGGGAGGARTEDAGVVHTDAQTTPPANQDAAPTPVVKQDAAPMPMDTAQMPTPSKDADGNDYCTPVFSECRQDTTSTQQNIQSGRGLAGHVCVTDAQSGVSTFIVDQSCALTEICAVVSSASIGTKNAVACTSCGVAGQNYQKVVKDGAVTTDKRGCLCGHTVICRGDLTYIDGDYFASATGAPNVSDPNRHDTIVNKRAWDITPGGSYDLEYTVDATSTDSFGHAHTEHDEVRAIGVCPN